MTSECKTRSNRANARESTGPKTGSGRARSARNAFRHGLTIPIVSHPIFAQQVSTLAKQINGGANEVARQLAQEIAEAQVEVLRVRSARLQLLTEKLNEPYYESRSARGAKVRFILRLLGPNPPDIPLPVVSTMLTTTPQGIEKFATILAGEAKSISALNRYERRALSRRNAAMRALTALNTTFS